VSRLLDVQRTARRVGTTTTLVHVPADRCPACSSTTVETSAAQGALFWMHGFGADVEHRLRSCPACGWALDAAELTRRPS
jgi:hypothetical protein